MTKRFSLVRECNAFLQCCITLGPARQFSLQNVKLSRIVTYRSKIMSEMQLKLKLHKLTMEN